MTVGGMQQVAKIVLAMTTPRRFPPPWTIEE
jgi:hypothetical protein